MLSQDKVKGLGGWLIFIVVSITITLLTHTLLTLNMCFEYFMGKPLPGANPCYGFPVTLIGLTLQVVILLFYYYIAYLLFRTKKLFPKFFISLCLINIALCIIGIVGIHLPGSKSLSLKPKEVLELIQVLLVGVIFIPYMLHSKRVRATFIN